MHGLQYQQLRNPISRLVHRICNFYMEPEVFHLKNSINVVERQHSWLNELTICNCPRREYHFGDVKPFGCKLNSKLNAKSNYKKNEVFFVRGRAEKCRTDAGESHLPRAAFCSHLCAIFCFAPADANLYLARALRGGVHLAFLMIIIIP